MTCHASCIRPLPPAPPLPSTPQVTDWGDLDRLTHRNYAADMRHALATAQPWDALGGRRAGTKPQAGATYYVYYTIEQYTRLALRMKLWPYPRAHFRHIASIPWM